MDDISGPLTVPVLDASSGLRRMRNNAAFYSRLLAQFADRLVQVRDQLVDFAEADDMAGLRIAAHSLKGGALTLGLQRLGVAAESLENHALDKPRMTQWLAVLLEEIGVAQTAISAQLRVDRPTVSPRTSEP